MLAATRSEWTRMSHRSVLVGWLGLTALFAGMINAIMFTVAADGTTIPGGGPGVSLPDAATLAGPTGLVEGLGAASSLFGVITLSFWAVVTATDYSTGLIRLLVAAQPRRWRLLAGKVAALTAFTAVAVTVALVVNVLAAPPSAAAAGISTENWGTDLLPTLASAWFNAFCAMLVWGVIGLVLAIVTRSSAIAISVGIGYVLVVESLIKMGSSSAGDWLPGTTLTALAQGGSAVLSYGAAIALGVGYVAVGLGIAGSVFTRRAITD